MKRVMLCLFVLVFAGSLVVGSLMANPTPVMAGQCPDYQPYEGTIICETSTYTPKTASEWWDTTPLGSNIQGYNIGFFGLWQRYVTYEVTTTRREWSVCYTTWLGRLLNYDSCRPTLLEETTTTEPDVTETKTVLRLPLTREPPPDILPPTEERFRQSLFGVMIGFSNAVGSSGRALEFPIFSENNLLVALTPGFDFGSSQFAELADAFASEPGLPPDEASRFVSEYQAISSGFAQVASALAAEAPTPTEESLTFLATKLADLQQHIDSLDVPEYRTATSHLGEAVNYLNDAALQVGLGLDSAEKQVTFLQDLQSLGVSLVNSGQSIKEPREDVGGIVETPQIEEPGTAIPDSLEHNYGASAGIIAGAIAGVTALISAAWYIRRRRTKAT